MPVKIIGSRSLETKLMRLACELKDDSRRVRMDHPWYVDIADALDLISLKLDAAAHKIRNRPHD